MNISYETQLLLLGVGIGLVAALIALGVLFLFNGWLEKRKHAQYREDALWLEGKKQEMEWREVLDAIRETPSDFRKRDQKRKRFDFWRYIPKVIVSILLVGAVLFSLWVNLVQILRNEVSLSLTIPAKTAVEAVSELPALAATATASDQQTPTETSVPAITEALPTPSATTVEVFEIPITSTLDLTLTLATIPELTLTPSPTPSGGGAGLIAFASDRSGIPQIWLMNLDGSNPVQITNSQGGACQPDWSPDGEFLVYISPCLSKKQEIYRGASLFTIHIGDREPMPLSTHSGGDYDPVWSPDGSRIAFTSLRNGNRPQIYILDLETSEVTSLSEEYSRDFQPAWSPDGEHILFISTRKGPYQIWMMNADGSDQKRYSFSSSRKDSFPVWSPEEDLIVFTQSEGVGSLPGLFGIEYPDGATSEFRLNPFAYSVPMREADFSPDGLWLVFEAWPAGANHEIFLMDREGTTFLQLTNDPAWDFDPTWQPVLP